MALIVQHIIPRTGFQCTTPGCPRCGEVSVPPQVQVMEGCWKEWSDLRCVDCGMLMPTVQVYVGLAETDTTHDLPDD